MGLVFLTACGASTSPATATLPTATAPIIMPELSPTTLVSSTPTAQPTHFTVRVDVRRDVRPISPLVYGVSDGAEDMLDELRPAFLSWGGNPSTRYNWRLGDAWNTGLDGGYRNTNFGYQGPSASDDFMAAAAARGIQVRLAVPTLGWVAKDNSLETCSFPLNGGGCGDGDGSSCTDPRLVADPELANVPSDVSSVVEWISHLTGSQAFPLHVVAMDNEPELWGFTHYDVHPNCTTYAEVLDQYLTYANAIRTVAPEVELAGPNTCCWHFYWNSAAGEADKALHEGADFLPWFLDQVRQHDEAAGLRTLDVLDVHYRPEGFNKNDNVDPATAGHRLRSTRSLWDASYVDESWIGIPVALIPRLMRLIEAHYPGTRLGLSEWSWGAESTMNGAIAIADVLGILGREQVYYAAYWRAPAVGSPGFYAFKLFTNYDDRGGHFGDMSVWSQTDDVNRVGSHAALDSQSGDLHVMLIHKQPDTVLKVQLEIEGFTPQSVVQQFRLSDGTTEIASTTLTWDQAAPVLALPPYSVTLLVLSPG